MKIDGSITMLVDEGGLKIEVTDKASCKTFLRVRLDSTQFCQAMSRLAHTPCESVDVYHLDKINKDQEHEKFEFKMPSEWPKSVDKEIAKKRALEVCPKGWEPDLYFNSQGSFYHIGDKAYARTTIRRWVAKGE